MDINKRITPHLLVKGNMQCSELMGGGNLYSVVNEKEVNITEQCFVIVGDVYFERFEYGDKTVAVTGGVSVLKQDCYA